MKRKKTKFTWGGWLVGRDEKEDKNKRKKNAKLQSGG